MTTIGSFTRRGDEYQGKLFTLSCKCNLRIVPVETRASPNAPDYRVFSGPTELGAAWKKVAESTGNDYLSVAIDDPSFQVPLNAALVATEADPDRFVLVWTRPRRDGGS